eukprot:jgi/Mesvir1/17519/Mv08772-RA.2
MLVGKKASRAVTSSLLRKNGMSVWHLQSAFRSSSCTGYSRPLAIHATQTPGVASTCPGASREIGKSVAIVAAGSSPSGQGSGHLWGRNSRRWPLAKPGVTASAFLVRGEDGSGPLTRCPPARSLFWGSLLRGIPPPVTPPGNRPLSQSARARPPTLLGTRRNAGIRHTQWVYRTVARGGGKVPPGDAGAVDGNVDREEKAQGKADRESIEYFRKLMEKVDKPSAVGMLSKLDYNNLLGVDTKAPGINPSKGTLYWFRLQVKRQHPNKITLVKNGEFYEVVGFDAVLMVQYAGLNPMGTSVPRAGCPRMNLRRTLEDLLDAGLSVAVCEEKKEASAHRIKSKERKTRFVAGVVTPAMRTYLHGTLDEGVDPSFLHTSPPIIGLAASDRGFTLIEIHPELFKCSYTEDLTEEAVMARISSVGWSPPLYLHASMSKASKGLWEGSNLQRDFEGEDKRRFGEGRSTHHKQSPYHMQLLNEVRKDLSMDAQVHFTITKTEHVGRPRPLYLSTAKEIGLLPSPGVPSLVEAMLPHDCPVAQRKYMEHYLLNPPPHGVADAVQEACALLQHVPVPNFVCPPAQRLVQLITAKEASHMVFRELARMAADVGSLFRAGGDSRMLAELLMRPTELHTGMVVPHDVLVAKCAELQACIEALVGDTSARAAHEQAGIDVPSAGLKGVPALSVFFASNEGFRGQVLPSVVADEYKAVAEHAEALNRAVEEDFLPHLSKLRRTSSSRKAASNSDSLTAEPDEEEEDDEDDAEESESEPSYLTTSGPVGTKKPSGSKSPSKPVVVFDVRDNVISINGRTPTTKTGDWEDMFIGQLDRNGKVMKNRLTTKRVDAALVTYVHAVHEAASAVKEKLQELAEECAKSMREIVTIASFCMVTKSLRLVVEEAVRKRWTAATVLSDDQRARKSDDKHAKKGGRPATTADKGGGRSLHIAGMWPYWMDVLGESVTVKNDIEMSGMYLLTGANMAGKSTVTRSICAVALLANCGLPVPADRAVVPRYDAFMVRKGSSDSPAYAKSSFAIECSGVATILQEATRQSLVLMDEFGKGTEARAGASLAAGVLEELDRVGCMGVFATHLHELLDMPTQLIRVQEMAMEVVTVTDASTGHERRRPSWRILPGRSTESLALDCAQDCGMPDSVLARAKQLLALHQGASPPPGSRPSYQGGRAAVAEKASTTVLSGDVADMAADEEVEEVGSEETEPAVVVKTLEDAAEVLRREVAAALTAEMQLTQSPSGAAEDIDGQVAMLKAEIIRDGMQPGVSFCVSRSCVYVLMDYQGYFYCGQTDDLLERIKYHARRRGQSFDYAFVPLPTSGPLASAGKSDACRLETLVTRALAREGYPMESTADAQHRNFGGRRARMDASAPLDPLPPKDTLNPPPSQGSPDASPSRESSSSRPSPAPLPATRLSGASGPAEAPADAGVAAASLNGGNGEHGIQEVPKVTKKYQRRPGPVRSAMTSRGGGAEELSSSPAQVYENGAVHGVMPASARNGEQTDDDAASAPYLNGEALNGGAHGNGAVAFVSDSQAHSDGLKPPSVVFREQRTDRGGSPSSRSRRQPLDRQPANEDGPSAVPDDCPF